MKRIQLNTSKVNKVGEQRKFYSDNIWYKVDSVNGMGFVEYLSRLVVNYSNISYIIPDYTPVIINNELGCMSHDITKGCRSITLLNMYNRYKGRDMREDLLKLPDITSRMQFTLNFLCNDIGMDYNMITNFFATLLQLDALLINPDRHLNNIEFLQSSKGYSPILIDFGRSLLCISNEVVQMDDVNIASAIRVLKPKPFGSFQEQYSLFRPVFKIDYVGLLVKIHSLDEVPFFFKRILLYQLRKYRDDLSSLFLARLVCKNKVIGYRVNSLGRVYDFKCNKNLPSIADIELIYSNNEFRTLGETNVKVKEITLTDYDLKILFL